MLWSFAKYAGCGNDFVLFDDRKELFPCSNKILIQQICHRQKGIGSDGVILLQHSQQADFRMRIFNSNGEEAEMCGNGIRCLAKYLKTLEFNQEHYSIETLAKAVKVKHCGSLITVEMGTSSIKNWNIPINFKQSSYLVHYLDTGVPHAVLFVDEIEQICLNDLGPYIRYHSLFAPKGVNVNVAKRLSKNEFSIRTYERGVEGETLACGTGATATALAAAYLNQIDSPIKIQTRSQEWLEIGFSLTNQNFSQTTMTGPATCIYHGEIELLCRPMSPCFSIDLK